MQYDHALGREGNMKNLYNQINKTNNTVFNNKTEADEKHEESVDGLIDIAEVASDEYEALAELGEMIADIYDALAELGELIAEGE